MNTKISYQAALVSSLYSAYNIGNTKITPYIYKRQALGSAYQKSAGEEGYI